MKLKILNETVKAGDVNPETGYQYSPSEADEINKAEKAEVEKKNREFQQGIESQLDQINQKMRKDKTYINSPEALADIEQYLVGIKLING